MENVNGEICRVLVEHLKYLVKQGVGPKSCEEQFSFTLSYFFPPGSGPDGRITKKDIDGFVPPKAAPVSEVEVLI